MRPVNAPVNDPAPSRLSYRMQRWMLTPGIRLALRLGIPLCIAAAASAAVLANADRRAAIATFVTDLRASIEERPEFMVALMAVDGAGPALSEEIRAAVPVDFPISSFDLELETIRAQITALSPVKEASVRIRPGGILQIDVTERVPVLLWRTHGGLSLIDDTGVHVDDVSRRTDRPDLPVVAGEGANTEVTEALALLAAAAPLGHRLRGLVRMGERRWDVVLDRNQRILLPEEDPIRALDRVLVLAEAQDLLERDLVTVDMRLANRPTIRMTEAATQERFNLKTTNGSGQ